MECANVFVVQHCIVYVCVCFSVADKKTKHLSAGDKRRLSIGEEIVHGPSLLLIDEPSTDLDVKDVSTLLMTFREMVNQDKTVVCAMHKVCFYCFMAYYASGADYVWCVYVYSPVQKRFVCSTRCCCYAKVVWFTMAQLTMPLSSLLTVLFLTKSIPMRIPLSSYWMYLPVCWWKERCVVYKDQHVEILLGHIIYCVCRVLL